MPEHNVDVVREGSVLKVILNRPEKANALSRAMLSRLTQIFRNARDDETLHVMTLEGAGGRVFCAGADLSELVRDPDDASNTVWEDMAEALASLPIFTIALINGPCIGGATALALGCDVRLATPEAVFGYPVLRNGVLPTSPDGPKMRALIGPGRQSLFLLGGIRIDAKEALDWGLIDRMVPRDDLAEAAMEVSAAAREADRDHLLRLKRFCKGQES